MNLSLKEVYMLSGTAIKEFRGSLHGEVIKPGDNNYDESRKIWNAMIDKKPALIVQVANAYDVSSAIKFARENKLDITIRGAGHNIAGNSICDGGLMIDFSAMKKTTVDVAKKTALVEPGATLKDFDAEVQKHGLATPVGINSTTGIAGLTLGGGFGWLTRKYGFTVDNLLSAEVVTVDGKKLRASEKENTDLFWAIRGGGGNFGVVTEFEFQLHHVGPEILAGLLVFPFAQAKSVLRQYKNFITTTPPEFNVWVVMRKAPPLPFLPEEVHGKEVVVLAIAVIAELEKNEKLVDSLRGFGQPVGEFIGRMPYINWQQMFDPLLTPGARNYWKSHNFVELKDGVIDSMIEYAGKLPSPQCEIFLTYLEGKTNSVAANAMAYSSRDLKYILNVHGRWDDAKQDKECINWAREFFDETLKFASSGAYVNFMTEEEQGRVAKAYGPNYDKLVQIKNKYDTNNLLKHNQNIKPTA
jgi:FAD/FMN-containing dehydrogenase